MPKPFIKWPGGKRALTAALIENMPKQYNRYFEPFVGGGALYWALQPSCAFLSDIDGELINAYRHVQRHPHALLSALQDMKNTRSFYERIRSWDRKANYLKRPALERAARFVYISHAGYNGLVRRNNSGHVNVAFGYRKALNWDAENLLACSQRLRSATLSTGCYTHILDKVERGDFVYLDLPYYGTSIAPEREERMSQIKRPVRCAIYTRKSKEDGLEMEFNSLDAQREACEAYIASQRSEGWIALETHYDDGGFTGKNTERPAFQRLIRDIQAGKVDLVAVYKIDRISRSLLDFVKIIELFDTHHVPFVSVTQSFNTATPMGRLMMNVLMSFAQYEREIISERIRDKHEASRKKGMWMGGCPPFGYDVRERKLIINENEAKIVREIFSGFAAGQTPMAIVRGLRTQGCTTKEWTTQKGKFHKGSPIHVQYVYRLLNNRVYLGEAVHKGHSYPGEHKAVIDRSLWDEVHRLLAASPVARGNVTRTSRPPALLKGFVRCGHCGGAMTPSSSTVRRLGQSYRYYVCLNALRKGSDVCPIRSVPAGELEESVLFQLKAALKAPELVAAIGQCLSERAPSLAVATQGERESLVRTELKDFDSLWGQLFVQEQRKLLDELLEKIVVSENGIDLHLKRNSLTQWIEEAQHANPSRPGKSRHHHSSAA